MSESLRSRVVEAVAEEICREVFGDEWDGEVPLVQRKQAARYMDKALDCLSEYADVWADAADELDEIEWPPKGMTLERAERMRSNTHLWFLAVLRNPV